MRQNLLNGFSNKTDCIICIIRKTIIWQTNIKFLGEMTYMKATGIVRRIDDLGRVVIPKEIRRTMRIREGDPLQMTLTKTEIFTVSVVKLAKRNGWE